MFRTILITSMLGVMATNPAFAQKRIGSWELVLDTPGMQVAKTVNDSGSVAGVICLTSTGACSAYVGSDLACEENGKYPMMINAPTGAHLATATCMTIAKAQYLILEEYSTAIAAFESGGLIGFALPMQSGKFEVLRFSTSGATAAIREAQASLARSQKPSPSAPTTTRNQTL